MSALSLLLSTWESAPARARTWTPTGTQVAWCAWAVAMFVVGAIGIDPARSDFQSFYASAYSWRTGEAMVAHRMDLSPPIVAVLLAPLTTFSLHWAFTIWAVAGMSAFAWTLQLLQNRLAIDRDRWIAIGGFLLAGMPTLHVLQEGQTVWLLVPLVTLAWLSKPSVTAGLWMALACLVKPPLVLMALLLPWRIALATGLCGLAGVALGVAVTGLDPWLDWAGRGSLVTWLGWPPNVSIWGVWARLISPGDPLVVGLAHLDGWMIGASVVALGWLAVSTLQTTGDRRWVLACLWGTMASPIGWIGYLLVALGPAIRSWPPGRWPLVVIGLLAVPMPLYGALAHLGVTQMASIYAVAAIGAWALWRSTEPTPIHVPCGVSDPSPDVDRKLQEFRGMIGASTDPEGCRRLMHWTQAYRCAECGRWFHRACLVEHFRAHGGGARLSGR